MLCSLLRRVAVLGAGLGLLGSAGAAAQAADSTAYLTGRFEPAQHPAFALIPAPLATRDAMYLRRDALAALQRMSAAAARNGITLRVVSATRNFAAQRAIWDSKWNGTTKVEGRDLSQERDLAKRTRTILTFSAMPGASRHHWGTDVDLNALTDRYFASGEGAKVFAWLTTNAARFGFCQPYTAKGPARSLGHEEEKWHWSYRVVSAPLLATYARHVTATDVTGFAGAAQGRAVVHEYVNSVAEACR